MDPLPISILLVSDRTATDSLVARAINDVPGTRLTVVDAARLTAPEFSRELNEFNLICIEDRPPQLDALELLLQIRVRANRLWVIAVIPTLANATRIRELFRAGAGDVLLPEEVGPVTLQGHRPAAEATGLPSMRGPTAFLIREIVEHLDEGFCTLDAQDRVSYCNRRFRELTGRQTGGSLKEWLVEVGGAGLDRQQGHLRLLDYAARPVEALIETGDGRQIPVLLSYYPLNAGPALPFAIGILSDLEPLKLAERQARHTRLELREKESLLGGLLSSVPQVAIAAFDISGDLQVISAGSEHIFGQTPDGLRGAAFHQLFDQLQQDANASELLEQSRVAPIAFSFIASKPDGTRLPCKAMVGPRFDDEGALNGLVAVCVDQHNEKALQERLIEHERLSAVGELVAGGHDLNNPLAGIAGFCEILQTQPNLPEKAQQFIAIISAQAERCRHIVENLLMFARPRPDAMVPVALSQLIEGIFELRSYHLIKHRIKVTRDLAPNLPRFTGNYHQLQQAFYNVIINAEHALRQTESDRMLTVKTRVVSGLLEVLISDSGPGIPPRLRPRIFDSFFTTKAVGQGTGLGLSLARKALRDHGGDLEIVETGERGATFRATVPVAADQRASAGREHRVGAERPSVPTSTRPGLRRIVVVDDEATMLSFYQEYFRDSGAAVLGARTVADALRLLGESPPDLLITDVRLPDGSGLELVEAISGIAKRIPVLLCTGTLPEEQSHAFTEGRSLRLLQKPFTLAELESSLAAICDPAADNGQAERK